MPKAKPSQVIVHRIEFQEKERDMLEAIVVGKTVKNVVVPVAITAGVASASYIGYKYAKATVDWGTDVIDDIKDNWYSRTADEVLTPEQKNQSPLESLADFGWFMITGRGILWDRK